ncbi:MAG: pilus (MSHA type) biogenesis protein MshL [Rhodocyclaceae bacterium]|nr:pilus (MSHA type) biogenesis protein MshL [Rhodocyclaceae bacterium]
MAIRNFPRNLKLAARGLAWSLACLSLAACNNTNIKPGATHQDINDELTRAASTRKTGNDALDRALMPPLQIAAPESATAVEQRFDLSVINAPASQVFMALVSGTKYSMLLPQDISGTITVSLKDVTLKEALDTIRELYGYEYQFKGNRIFIQANTLQTRVFQINYLASQRQGSSSLRVTGSSIASSAPASGTTSTGTGTTTAPAAPAGGGSGTDTSRVSTSSNTDFWRDLTAALTAVVGSDAGRQVIINPLSGVALVRGFPADLRNVENYLKATQLIVERQVMLEAKIIDVQLNEEFQSGVNWARFNGAGSHRWSMNANTDVFNVPGGAPAADSTVTGSATGVLKAIAGASSLASGGVLGLAFQSASFTALLNFLETQGTVSVLSSPRIATINNQKAVLKVGRDELFVTNITTTSTTSTTGGTTSTPSLTLQPYFSGISLDVTPQIDEEGNIILHIHPAVSTVAEKEKVIDLGTMGLYKLPLASSTINETDSIVRVQEGNIVAIGGLMRNEQYQDGNGLPGVKDVPVAGSFFGNKSNIHRKRELVILIKPTLINSDKAWQKDLEETRDRVESLDPRRVITVPPAK